VCHQSRAPIVPALSATCWKLEKRRTAKSQEATGAEKREKGHITNVQRVRSSLPKGLEKEQAAIPQLWKCSVKACVDGKEMKIFLLMSMVWTMLCFLPRRASYRQFVAAPNQIGYATHKKVGGE
jgi:hypothetical protein